MNWELLIAAALKEAPNLIAALYAIAMRNKLTEQAEHLAQALKSSDANADELMANAVAAGATPPAITEAE